MSTHAEKQWKQIDTAPVGVGLRLIVADHSGHHFLPYECKLTATGWINTATGHPLASPHGCFRVQAFDGSPRLNGRARTSRYAQPSFAEGLRRLASKPVLVVAIAG